MVLTNVDNIDKMKPLGSNGPIPHQSPSPNLQSWGKCVVQLLLQFQFCRQRQDIQVDGTLTELDPSSFLFCSQSTIECEEY